MKITIAFAIKLLLVLGCSTTPEDNNVPEPPTPSATKASAPRESGLHEKLLVLDSHLDTPIHFHRPSYDFSRRGDYAEDGTQIDLPRLKEGGLDGGFWVIYTSQGSLDEASYVAARTSALLRQMAIREMAAKYSDSVELAFSADDAARIHESGKISVFQSIENAYPLGEDLSLLETFYVGGVRMLGPVHFSNNQFADSSTDETEAFGGLSSLGEALVREANRLGMMIDASHASDDALRDMMAISTTPVILSHSGPDGVYEHGRNVPDELLTRLAESGGVIHVNAYPGYLEALEVTPDREAAMERLNEEFGPFSEMTEEQREAYRAARRELNVKFPPDRSSFDKYLEHLLYTLDLVGTDHVGIGADWDGGGGVSGMEDVASVPRITDALLEAGYSPEDIAKIWSGNLLRLMREVEAAKTADLSSPSTLN